MRLGQSARGRGRAESEEGEGEGVRGDRITVVHQQSGPWPTWSGKRLRRGHDRRTVRYDMLSRATHADFRETHDKEGLRGWSCLQHGYFGAHIYG